MSVSATLGREAPWVDVDATHLAMYSARSLEATCRVLAPVLRRP